MSMSKCRGCGAEINWIKMYGTKKSMPVNPEPVRVLYGEGKEKFVRQDGVIIQGRKIGDAFDDQNAQIYEAYESHFATCPQANDFRRK